MRSPGFSYQGTLFASYFFKNSNTLRYYEDMPRLMKSVLVILLAVGVAAGAAVFLSRGTDQPATDTPSTRSHVEIKPGSHLRGAQDAQLTLAEFGDYECPSCGAWHPLIKEILSRYPAKLRLDFHHYPLVSIHPNAMAGAIAAEAAGEQGKFWEMHDQLFQTQRDWGEKQDPKPVFLVLAYRIGLDVNRFNQSMSSPALQSKILQDVSNAQDLRIDGTPTFYLNGEQIHPKASIEELVQLIESRLHK
jgi:protein-disulfide isomerase